MAIVVPDAGELRLLDIMLKVTSKTDAYHLRLYNHNYTPDENTTYHNFTETTFDSYTMATLTRSGWTASSTTIDNKANSSYSSILSWTCGTVGDTIYGYWVEDALDRTVLWAEKFTVYRTLASGNVLEFIPKFALSTGDPV